MKINAAIQLLPLDSSENKFAVIDKAIALIKESGLSFQVCPFETVVEGESVVIYDLLRAIQETTLNNGCSELLLNVKIHAANKDLLFADKLKNYR
jgi:uncharacterized protein YqgV (UPF0045/DUF77 family)